MKRPILLQNVYVPILRGTGRFQAGAWSERSYELRGWGGDSGPEIMEISGYRKYIIPVAYDWNKTWLSEKERWGCSVEDHEHKSHLAMVLDCGEIPAEGFDPAGKAIVGEVPYGCYDHPLYYTAEKAVRGKAPKQGETKERDVSRYFERRDRSYGKDHQPTILTEWGQK